MQRAHEERLLEAEADQADSRAADEAVAAAVLPADEAASAVVAAVRLGVVLVAGVDSPEAAAEASREAEAASQEDEANRGFALEWLCTAQEHV